MKSFSFKRVCTAIKNNFRINRSVPILIFVLTAIVMFLSITLPVSSAEDGFVSTAVDSERYMWYISRINDCWENIVGLNGIQGVCAAVIAIGSAMLSSITLTAFARDKKGCDFWSSQPITRREHLTANLISGFLSFATAIIPTWYLSLAIGHMFTTVKPMTLMQIFSEQTPVLLFVLLFYLSVEAVCFLAATVTGSVMSSLVVMATLLGYPALMTIATGGISNDIFNTHLLDILEHNYTVFAYSSPVLRYFFSFTEAYRITAFDVILYAVTTVIIIALLLFIVKKRRLELSQEAIVFPVLRYPIQYLWSFLFTLFFAWFLYNVIWSPVWFFIGAIIGLLLSFMVFNMIFERSFTGLFKKPLHLILCGVAFAVFVIVLVADVFGMYKAPTPDFSRAESFSLYYYENGNYEEGEEPYYHEWIDIWSEDNAELSERDREKLERLWKVLAEAEGNGVIEVGEKETWYNVHITVLCKNDPTAWRQYTNIRYINTEIYELLSYFEHNFRTYTPDSEKEASYEEKYPTVTVEPYDPSIDAVEVVPEGPFSAPEPEEMAKEIAKEVLTSGSLGIIGGADGPTAIVVD